MAHLLHFNAEFYSFDDFERALAQYCQTTHVDNQPIQFIQSTCKYIKNDVFESDKQNRLKYQMIAGRCKYAKKTPCSASYKLVLHLKSNGDHVLRLDTFHGDHSSHNEIEKFDAKLTPTPTPMNPNEPHHSADKLQLLMTKVCNRAKTMSADQCKEITEILGNLWDRMEKNIMFKVDFSDYPSASSELFIQSIFCQLCLLCDVFKITY